MSVKFRCLKLVGAVRGAINVLTSSHGIWSSMFDGEMDERSGDLGALGKPRDALGMRDLWWQ